MCFSTFILEFNEKSLGPVIGRSTSGHEITFWRHQTELCVSVFGIVFAICVTAQSGLISDSSLRLSFGMMCFIYSK